MKRVLNGVHVLMAVGLIVALAACSSGGNNSGIKQERDQALAAAAQAEIDKMAAEAAAAQAEIDKMAAEAAASQAEIDKMAAEATAAQAEIDKMAADAAAAQAEIDKMAADAAAAQAEIDKMAAQAAAAQAEIDKMAAEEALAGVPKTIEELEAELEAAETTRDMAQTAADSADMAYEDAKAARMDGQTAVQEAMPDGLTDAIAALDPLREAEMAAMSAAMEAADDLTAAQAAVDALDTALANADTGPAKEAADKADAVAAVKGARAAFDVLDAIAHTDVDTAELSTTARKEATSLKVSHDGTAAKISATMTTGASDTPPNRTTTVFLQTEGAAPAIPGWNGVTMRSKTKNADAVVYSDIAAPTYKLFAVRYDTNAKGALEFGAAGEDANAHWASADIPAAHKWVGGALGGSIDGSYGGVPGTFTCAGTGCPPSNDFPERRIGGSVIGTEVADAAILGDGWSFKPADEAAMVKVADPDYLSFGYWLSKDKTTKLPNGFAVWYGGKSGVAASADIDTLDEKVTYTGVAGGKFVTQSTVPNTAQAGYFTADAVIVADFTLEADEPGTVEGTISDFKEGDSAPLGDLELKLKGTLAYANAALSVNIGETPNTAVVEATSGGLKHGVVGEWEAQFFGTDKNTNVPTGVAGAFNATIGEEHAVVVGGFGATK